MAFMSPNQKLGMKQPGLDAIPHAPKKKKKPAFAQPKPAAPPSMAGLKAAAGPQMPGPAMGGGEF